MHVLVTGAAGFIGFHTARVLLERGDTVIGLDNINDYYEVSLKHARLDRLRAFPSFQFIKADLADRAAIADVFGKEQVTEQELLDALRQLKVADLLVQTLSTISSLAYHRLAEEHRDLEQARLAIEALRALTPVLAGAVPPELVRDFEQVTANLQLAYADAVAPKSDS